jgi:hypothetical protein
MISYVEVSSSNHIKRDLLKKLHHTTIHIYAQKNNIWVGVLKYK